MISRLLQLVAAVLFIYSSSLLSEELPIEYFSNHADFNQLKISPNGKWLAATAPMGDSNQLVLIDRATMKPIDSIKVTASSGYWGGKTRIGYFGWANEDRLVFNTVATWGDLDRPYPTGDIFAVNGDGSKRMQIFGQTALQQEIKYGSNIESIMQKDPRNILVTKNVYTPNDQVHIVDIYSGRSNQLMRNPARYGSLRADKKGNVRYAWGVSEDDETEMFYRDVDSSEWQLLYRKPREAGATYPIAFTADNEKVVVRSDEVGDVAGLYLMDPSTREKTLLFERENMDADNYVRDKDFVPIGIHYYKDGPKNEFFDEESKEAMVFRMLQKSFPGQWIAYLSWTADGKEVVVWVGSDKNPGDYYLFNLDTMQAQYLLSARPWIDPSLMSPMRKIAFEARDGLKIGGYLTTPAGSEGRSLPMVVLVHGGPHGIYDFWGFDSEAQLLANRGYAVLQINYRGSGGRGKEYEQMGYGKWGAEMQDDVTDGTLWAIEQGIANPEKVCIYGGSYGGYAALMGIVREPDLYACAVGYVGVYDLGFIFKESSTRHFRFLRAFFRKALGTDKESLIKRSPVHLADKIKTPLFLVHGKQDQVAPIAHYNKMRSALDGAGIKYEAYTEQKEGHGFWKEENRKEFYTKLVAFFDKHTKN